MKQPWLLTLGLEGPFLAHVKQWAEGVGLRVRELQQIDACRNLLRQGNPGIVLLKIGRDVEHELQLVQEVHDSHLAMKCIVLADADNPLLTGLAWDLGAAYIHFPSLPLGWLFDALGHFIEYRKPT